MLNFKNEAAYKAYLAKCDAERKASEDIAFRNHGEYIKYLTKMFSDSWLKSNGF